MLQKFSGFIGRAVSILQAFAMLFVSGCVLGPEYVRPATHAASADKFMTLFADAQQAGDSVPQWWQHYQDPVLNGWVSRLADSNLDLKTAVERVLQAEALVEAQRGVLWPALTLGGNATRSFMPDPLDSASRSYATGADIRGTVTWQVDLFGRVRRAIESAEYSLLASGADRQALEQTLIADLVRRRAAITLLNQEIIIQRRIVDSRRQTSSTVARRYRLGVKNASAVDVHSARENESTARAQLAALQQQLGETMLGVDVLLNQRPGTLREVSATFPLTPATPLPRLAGPAALLDRRPDIVGSELRAMAANAGIGIAIADLLPDLNISLERGFVGDQVGGLLTNNNGLGLIAGRLSTRLFEGGRLRAAIRLREAQARELLWQYAQTVLNALFEVESALVQERFLSTQVTNLQASVVAGRAAEILAEARYQRGITPLLELLETQRRRQNAERNLLAAQRASWDARINLHLALGGDWLSADTQTSR